MQGSLVSGSGGGGKKLVLDLEGCGVWGVGEILDL